jgi:hypothetical protein
MRWLTPRRQMTYAQWLELCRKQAAEREAEPETSPFEASFEESDPEEAEADNQAQAAGPAGRPIVSADAAQEPVSAEPGVPRLDGSMSRSPLDEDPPSLKDDPTWLPAVEYFQAGEPFSIGDINLSPFTIPHDAADPVGFVFSSEGVRMGFATDLGYISPNVREQLQNLDLLLLESNHDLEMLRDGPYPWAVKQRVLSRVGHLSNDAAAEFLSTAYDGQAAVIILAHLSENNNLPELARVAAERALLGRATLLANRLLLAEQRQPLSPISF